MTRLTRVRGTSSQTLRKSHGSKIQQVPMEAKRWQSPGQRIQDSPRPVCVVALRGTGHHVTPWTLPWVAYLGCVPTAEPLSLVPRLLRDTGSSLIHCNKFCFC